MRSLTLYLAVLLASTACFASSTQAVNRQVRVGDIAAVEGVRSNPLVGYGIAVGLNGTGDRRQTMFTIQVLASAMQRMGVQIPVGTAPMNNVAAVFVTAMLSAYITPDISVVITDSSVG